MNCEITPEKRPPSSGGGTEGGCIESFLRQWAERCPDKPAVICDGETVTYGQLWEQATRLSQQYRQEAPRAQVIRSTQSIGFLLTYFACHLAGKAIVPLENDCSESKFTGIQDEINACRIPEHVADILYTTGTTGRQKGIMISHKAITADAGNLVSAMQYTEDLLFVISGPLNHIGSLSKVWPAVMVGATLCITPGMKDMNAFLGALRLPYPRVATFLVPSGIRMLLKFARKELAELADRIDFIETGAAPMPQADMEELCRILPDTRLYNTYASTETGIVCTHNYNAGYCVAGCLGNALAVLGRNRCRGSGDVLGLHADGSGKAGAVEAGGVVDQRRIAAASDIGDDLAHMSLDIAPAGMGALFKPLAGLCPVLVTLQIDNATYSHARYLVRGEHTRMQAGCLTDRGRPGPAEMPAGPRKEAPATQKAPELESSTGLVQKSLAATYFPT